MHSIYTIVKRRQNALSRRLGVKYTIIRTRGKRRNALIGFENISIISTSPAQ